MAIADDKRRAQTVIDAELDDRIGELAERMGVSHSKMIGMLLEAAVEDNEWIIKVVTSKFAQHVRAALGGKRKKGRSDPAKDAG